MSNDYYCKSSFWELSDGNTEIAPGRLRLLSLVARRSVLGTVAGVVNDVKPVVLRNDNSTGEMRYGFAVPAGYASIGAQDPGRCQGAVPIDIGGDGILFEDGMYLEIYDDGKPGDTTGTGTKCCVDAITFFYRES